MRVTLATFIIILFTIIAILLVKMRPTTIHYISLEPYYAATKYCVSWMPNTFETCLRKILPPSLLSLLSGAPSCFSIIQQYPSINYLIERIKPINTRLYKCLEFLKKEGFSGPVSIVYHSCKIKLKKTISITSEAYLVLVEENSRDYMLISDSMPLDLIISNSRYCSYSYVVCKSCSAYCIEIKCSKGVSTMYVKDERGLSVEIKS